VSILTSQSHRDFTNAVEPQLQSETLAEQIQETSQVDNQRRSPARAMTLLRKPLMLKVVVWASLAVCAAHAGDVSLVRAISSQANGPRIIRESTAALLVGAGLTAVLFWAVGQATGY
jgi:hypothetical protein